jgi:hypothetical protein
VCGELRDRPDVPGVTVLLVITTITWSGDVNVIRRTYPSWDICQRVGWEYHGFTKDDYRSVEYTCSINPPR